MAHEPETLALGKGFVESVRLKPCDGCSSRNKLVNRYYDLWLIVEHADGSNNLVKT